MNTATDCQRLLDCQPLLDQLPRIDTVATASKLREFDATASLEAQLAASIVLVQNDIHTVLPMLRSDIDRCLESSDPVLLQAAQHSAFATAFADVLDADARASLALPWAFCAVTLPERDEHEADEDAEWAVEDDEDDGDEDENSFEDEPDDEELAGPYGMDLFEIDDDEFGQLYGEH